MDNRCATYDRLLDLSNRLQKATGSWHRIVASLYWRLMYMVNRFFEMLGYPRQIDVSRGTILNFGCGLHLTAAVNSDLFAIHRYLKGRRRPDVYLSGAATPSAVRSRFDGIVCEHVLEHMLPAHACRVLSNLYKMLRRDGFIQISVPSVSRFITCCGNRISIDILQMNDLAYNYGHRFMHDETTLVAMVQGAGFCEIEVNSYATSPAREHLLAGREPESIYIIAKKR